MSPIQDCKDKITTDSGSIDFEYYDDLARQLRTATFTRLFRSLRSSFGSHTSAGE